MNLVINRRLADVAAGVCAGSSRPEKPVCGGHRFLFSAPRDKVTLLGTWYTADAPPPERRGSAAFRPYFGTSTTPAPAWISPRASRARRREARGEIVRVVREEMAVKLTDIVFRRTAPGAVPGPERVAVEAAASGPVLETVG